MDRMACVDLPAFPLQILLRHHPDWTDASAAVIDKDHPQGRLLWVNEHARAQRILPGMRYAAALALSRQLRASVISPATIEEESETLRQRLRFYSPEVEQDRHDPGTFWLGADGLGLLHPSFQGWAVLIRDDLGRAGYEARVAVGFSRFGSYAAARAAGSKGPLDHGRGGAVVPGTGALPGATPVERDDSAGDGNASRGIRGIIVFDSIHEERAAVRGIPMDRIACDPDFRDTLARLGIFQLGGFIDLPASGLRRRFGEEALRLHERARGESWTPFEAQIPEDPYERRVVLDTPESDTTRLREIVAGELRLLLERLRARDRALTAFTLELGFDRPGPDGVRRARERLSPATPTRDLDLLLDLLRLRLESLRLPCGVVDLRLEVSWITAAGDQLSLFAQRARRDLEAANRALARLRAGFGEDSVCAAEPRDAHLPEARFLLRPLQRLEPAQPSRARRRVLVRRLLTRPAPISLDRLSSRDRDHARMKEATAVKTTTAVETTKAMEATATMTAKGRGRSGGTLTLLRSEPATGPALSPEPAGMRIRGLGIVEAAAGPFLISGGWWKRPVIRHYWYALIREVSGNAPPGERVAGRASMDLASSAGSGPDPGDREPAGHWCWIFHDALRRRWFLHGEIE